MFVVIDGPNGVGKTSIAEGIQMKLSMTNKKIFITKEPSETEFGQYVKQNEETYSGEYYGMLIASDRQYHTDTIIKPHLINGEIVICDRYIASSLVLQNFDGMSKESIWKINKHILIPDLYVILLANAKEIEERLSKREQLSKFEIKMSRDEEIKYFIETINFLKQKEINVLKLDNNDGDLERNISTIINFIQCDEIDRKI
jgi:dTMP kinase